MKFKKPCNNMVRIRLNILRKRIKCAWLANFEKAEKNAWPEYFETTDKMRCKACHLNSRYEAKIDNLEDKWPSEISILWIQHACKEIYIN